MFLRYIEANALNSIPHKTGLRTFRVPPLPTFAKDWKSALEHLQIDAVVQPSRIPWHLPADPHPSCGAAEAEVLVRQANKKGPDWPGLWIAVQANQGSWGSQARPATACARASRRLRLVRSAGSFL
jgi:hypothetical protein